MWTHRTVLLNEAIAALLTNPDGHYIDATFGRGGHSRLLLEQLSSQGRLTVFDKDLEAIAEAQSLSDVRVNIRHEGFAHLADLPAASAAGVLLDLGISSPQIDNPARGFSFRSEGPLDMRMDTTRGQSVAEWLADASIETMTEVIRDYGEERFAVQIAKALVAGRAGGDAIRTTTQLSQLVARAVRTREAGQDPATRTFQALRIHVNAELEALDEALNASLALLASGARLVVIAFHSLEDRRVKTFIARESRDEVDRRAPFAPAKDMRLVSIARIKPSAEETTVNPRARSAILRVAERTAVT